MSPCSRRTHTPAFRSIAGNRIKALALRASYGGPVDMSRLSLEEICDQGKSKLLALFRMKLRAGIIAAPDQGRDRSTIVAIRHQIGRVLDLQVVTMDEICVQAGRPQRKAVEKGMRPMGFKRIPAHMGDLESRIIGVDAANLPADPAHSIGYRILAAALRHELHADADTEKRPAVPADRLIQSFHHASHRIKAAPTIRKSPNPRQYDAIGLAHRRGIARYRNRLRRTALARCPFKC